MSYRVLARRLRPCVASPALLMVLAAAGAARAQTVPLNGWQQTFADEFERPTLDTARWNIANYAAPHNGEAQYYSPANIGIVAGAMRITSERRNIGGREFASGNITTRDKFAQTFGRFEMRAKLPGTQGLWPAFWLLPNTGAWPPEIDIMELLGHQPSTVYFTNHWGTYPAVASDSKSFTGANFTTGYHTFAVEWSPGRLEFFVDGVKRATNTGGVPAEPFYIILNTAVGGQWPGYPNASTVFPQYFDAKYVRAYTRTLFNPGFDNFGPSNTVAFDGWQRFGTTATNTTITRTGGTSAKLSGGTSGVYQDTPARPGDRWRATAWWNNSATEPMAGANRASTDIEWINASGGIISIISAPAIDAASPRDLWIPSMVEGTAPAGTVSARTVLRYTRPASAAGAAFVDDVDLQRMNINTTLEDRGSTGTVALSGWSTYGSASASFNFRRSGTLAARLTGRNIAGGSTSGISQDFPVRPGQVWHAGTWWLHPASDRLQGANTTQVNIEWLDSGKANIGTSSVAALSAASPTDQFISTPITAAAPAGAVWARLALNLNQPALSPGTAYVDDPFLTNLLANSTFEDQGPTENEPLYGWTGFGNRFGDARLIRTGTVAAKLFGTFTSATGDSQPSGLSQVFSTQPGQRWRASAWFAHLADDRLAGGNTAWVKLEWLNASGGIIAADQTAGLTAASPTGVYSQSTVESTAPAGATRGRLVLLFTQTGFSGGAALIDDVTLEPITPCGDAVALDVAPSTTPCAPAACSPADVAGGGPAGDQPDGTVDGSDFIAFINSFGIGDAAVDPLADIAGGGPTGEQPDGTIDGSDFIAFINAFAIGC